MHTAQGPQVRPGALVLAGAPPGPALAVGEARRTGPASLPPAAVARVPGPPPSCGHLLRARPLPVRRRLGLRSGPVCGRRSGVAVGGHAGMFENMWGGLWQGKREGRRSPGVLPSPAAVQPWARGSGPAASAQLPAFPPWRPRGVFLWGHQGAHTAPRPPEAPAPRTPALADGSLKARMAPSWKTPLFAESAARRPGSCRLPSKVSRVLKMAGRPALRDACVTSVRSLTSCDRVALPDQALGSGSPRGRAGVLTAVTDPSAPSCPSPRHSCRFVL